MWPVYTTIWYPPRSDAPAATAVPAPTQVPPATATPEWFLPPAPDSRVRAAPTAIPTPVAATEDWLVIDLPVQTYSTDMDPLWIAEPGDWYRVSLIEENYALAVWEEDVNEWPVWIELDSSSIRQVVVVASASGGR
jgi:hypothetical protein